MSAKRMLLVVAGIAAFGVLTVLVVGATQPTTWKVERSVTIDALPLDIHPLVEAPAEWKRWLSGPDAEAQGMKTTTFGPEKGVGAGHTWEGPGTKGRMEITASEPSTGIGYAMTMEDSQTPASGTIHYRVEGERTTVTWTDAGDLGMFPIGGLMAPMMEGALGPHFEQALTELDRLAEARKAERLAAPPEAPPVEEAPPGAPLVKPAGP